MEEYLYTKEQVAQLRQKLMDEYVIPLVKICFRKYPQLRSATFLVAQYWNDEADDAVHDYFLFSVLDTLDLEAASKAEEDYKEDTINLPGFGEDPYLAGEARDELEQEGYRCYWDDNGDDIAIEIVGQMLRPWLDGVRPDEW
jgi:hypothetical protein